MAIRMLNASATLSTSAGSWKKVEAAYLLLDNADNDYVDTFPAKTSDAFQTAAVNIQGVVVNIIKVSVSTISTVTIDLMEGATVRATTGALLISGIPMEKAWQYFTFTTPYAASALTNYTIRMTANISSRILWTTDSALTKTLFAVVGDGDDVTKIASGDTCIIKDGVTLTIDENLTLTPKDTMSMIVGGGSTVTIPNPASPIKLDLGAGSVLFSSTGNFFVGSSATRVTAGNVTIENTTTANWIFKVMVSSPTYSGGVVIKMYGTYSAGLLRLLLDADAATTMNSGVVTTVEDIPASWTAGDTLFFAANDDAVNEASTYDLHTKGSKTVRVGRRRGAVTTSIASPCVVTLSTHVLANGDQIYFRTTGALPTGITAGTVYYARSIGVSTFHIYDTYAHAIDTGSTVGRIDTSGTQSGVPTLYQFQLLYTMLNGGALMNQSEAQRTAGIHLLGVAGTMIGSGSTYPVDHYILDGIYSTVVPRLFGNAITSTISSELKNFFAYYTTTIDILIGTTYLASVFENFHVVNLSVTDGNAITGKNMTLNNVTWKNQGGLISSFLTGTNNTLSDFVITGYDLTNRLGISGVNHTLRDVSIFQMPMVFYNCYNLALDNVAQRGARSALTLPGTLIYSSTVRAVDCTFGVGTTNEISDIGHYAETYSQVIAINCKIGSMGFDTSGFPISLTLPGTYFRFADYNQTANDDRSWLTYGYMVRTGDGLTDTTVHSTGSGKFAIRFESASSTDLLEWEFPVPIGNILGKDMMIGVWCKINSATYYAGTKQMPRLTVDYDNGTIAYAEAAESTDWQFLFVPFKPTTSYGQATVTLSTKTDATGSNAYVYFDDFSALYPAGTSLNLGGMDLWADGLPITPPIATSLSAFDVWAADPTLFGSNTVGDTITIIKKTTKLNQGLIIAGM